eukprot:CAMPEP_0185841532 /NCGR_PEP_ID=MMETSP1353-20130828/17942_1 /TAXON_ID=1077150 /ORGANISM="Erythrolobus australicus, Strain CCMP3124" /LENGTH=496 /DNA_ID=CAMNT_0028541011 /DNA_START=30 /DNA_END=1520 /DNA_ORIENTATION=-
MNVPIFELRGSELLHTIQNTTVSTGSSANAAEAQLVTVFEQAKLAQARLDSTRASSAVASRCIVFLDDIDLVCVARQAGAGATEFQASCARFVAQLLSLMDGSGTSVAGSASEVLVVGTATNPHVLDSALRRSGRFDVELVLALPNEVEREQILVDLYRVASQQDGSAASSLIDREVLRHMALCTPAFVAADLVALMNTLSSHASSAERAPSNRGMLPSVQESTTLCRALGASLLRRSMFGVTVDATTWADIGGYEEVKARLRRAVEWPLQYPDVFQRLRIRQTRGILLHGPPGCAKTSMVRAVAHTCRNVAFLQLSGADVYSCYLGEAERIVRDAFRIARAASPSIIFIDELDAIVGRRGVANPRGGVQERVLSSILNEMDGIRSLSSVLVLAATNRVDMIDDALLRPGRFDELIEVPYPDERACAAIVEAQLARLAPKCAFPLGKLTDDIVPVLVGKSGAQIAALCREALKLSMSESTSPALLSARHFEGAAKA